MPRDSQGNTQPLPGTIVATGDTVLPSQHNPMVVDVYAMMTQSLSRDGQGGMRSNLDMSTFKVINVANGTANADAINKSQLDAAINALINGVFLPLNRGGIINLNGQGQHFQVQFGSSVVTTTAGGAGFVFYNTPFAAVPVTIAVDGAANSAVSLREPPASSAGGFTFVTNPAVPSVPFRCNWIALGLPL